MNKKYYTFWLSNHHLRSEIPFVKFLWRTFPSNVLLGYSIVSIVIKSTETHFYRDCYEKSLDIIIFNRTYPK